MEIFLFKVILTPALIGIASLVGRRWGPAVSGWLIGLPFTSGPIVLFLALGHGPAFARLAAIGTLTGLVSQALFCLAYAWMAAYFPWPQALVGGIFAFAGATAVFQGFRLTLGLLFPGILLVLVAVLFLMPRQSKTVKAPQLTPPWDIPARMALATAYVLLLTGLAPILGPHLTGLAAPFPLYASILAVFAHHQSGSTSAIEVLNGLLFGLFSFSGFFLLVSVLIESIHVAAVFTLATAVALALQGVSLWLLKRFR